MTFNSEPQFDDMGFGSRGFLEDMEGVGALDQVTGEAPVADQAPSEPVPADVDQPRGIRRVLSVIDKGVVESIKGSSVDFN